MIPLAVYKLTIFIYYFIFMSYKATKYNCDIHIKWYFVMV